VSAAYIDTSALVAIAFGEPGAEALAERLEGCEALYASNLLEAELRAVFEREGVRFEAELLTWVDWVLPDRPLTREIGHAQSAGSLRGADLFHLACALYLAPDPGELAFVTLDAQQGKAAAALGFRM
jgi:predicted nucleic acid-binding protein